MEISIKGEPEEIAGLLNAMRDRQEELRAYSDKPEVEVVVSSGPYLTFGNVKEGVKKAITEYSELGHVKIKTSYSPPVPKENYLLKR